MQDSNAARLYRNARREARMVIVVWALALVWSVGYSYVYGYQHAPDSWVVQAGLAGVRGPADFVHIFGFPDWVFFGILIPWFCCTAFTIGICLGISDDDLGADTDEGTGHGH